MSWRKWFELPIEEKDITPPPWWIALLTYVLLLVLMVGVAALGRGCEPAYAASREIRPPEQKALQMRCTRWAAIVQAVVDLQSPARLIWYMKRRPDVFTPLDLMFVPDATRYVNLKGLVGKGAFATAMVDCGEWRKL